MPQPRLYPNDAARQAAHRERAKKARDAERAAKGLPPAPMIPSMPGTRRWKALIETAEQALTTAYEELNEYIQDRSEEWQQTERATAMRDASELLEELSNQLQDINL